MGSLPKPSKEAISEELTTEELEFFIDYNPPKETFLSDVISGLSKPQKQIPPKYFYDEKGSELFDQICKTKEYYVTRTEMDLLEDIGPKISELAGPNCKIIEFGSGASKKIRTLLEALVTPKSYIAIDISKEFLVESANTIAQDYPEIEVGAICADFLKPVNLPVSVQENEGNLLGFFPGSTIGNFTTNEAVAFLKTAHNLLSPHGALLIGVDLKKDETILEAAYNDAQGITADFNLNILERINKELGANFTTEKFEHEAVYNSGEGRIEMHLRSKAAQSASIDGHTFAFDPNETIHTENSHKYSIEEFKDLAAQADFSSAAVWVDPDKLFSLHYLTTAK